MVRWSAAAPGASARAGLLNRRTRHVPIRTEYAAIACLRLQQHPAPFAVIEELAGICRHCLRLSMAAGRAGDRRGECHQVTLINRGRTGSMSHAIAIATIGVAMPRRTAGMLERRAGVHAEPVSRLVEHLRHHSNHPPASASPPRAISGIPRKLTTSSTENTPAPAPSPPSGNRTMEQEEASTAPSPAPRPRQRTAPTVPWPGR
jgi:hypothetical protein